MTTLADLERRAKAYAESRSILSAIVQELDDAIESLKRAKLPDLKAAVNATAERHDRLKAQIEANPDLFVKPRSVVLHGIKFGYRKGTGGLHFDDAEQVVKLIRKHFPEAVDVLVKVTETPVKKALEQLSAAELKKVAVTVKDVGDEVFIKPTDSAVDKLVDQLLQSATEECAS